MSRTFVFICTLLVATASWATAGTFSATPYLADQGVDVLTRAVAQDLVDRQLFGEPYASVVVGNVDLYDRFPYVEARYFQVVSDPRWNRLLFGEIGRGLSDLDGTQTSFGRLDGPRGLSADAQGRVYVADTANDRVLVFQSANEFHEFRLEPLFAVEGLSRPHDVAHSDAGTPFDAADDLLYVANTGRNEIVRFELVDGSARRTASLGSLGSGEGHLAGPTALTVGRYDGANTDALFVADAHNGRIVKLVDDGSSLRWVGDEPHQLGLVSSLDSDHWGNVYASAPGHQSQGVLGKYSPQLLPLDELSSGLTRPRSFHVPFVNVHDHRDGSVRRAGQGSGILVEEWTDSSGMRLLDLGVELRHLSVDVHDEISLRFTLTDRAHVDARVVDPADGRTVAHLDAGTLDAGAVDLELGAAEFQGAWSDGEYRLTVRARSSYDEKVAHEIETSLALSAGGNGLPQRVSLLGNHPNPFNPSTTIEFEIPDGAARGYRLEIFDARGRRVRELAAGEAGPGRHSLLWNGQDDGGGAVGSGVYLYRLQVGDELFSRKMVLTK